jgi:hypothetical protein
MSVRATASYASAAIALAFGMVGAANAITIEPGDVNLASGTTANPIDFTNSGGYSVTSTACTACVAVTFASPLLSSYDGNYGFSISMGLGTQVAAATAVSGEPGLYTESYNAPSGGGTIGVTGTSTSISAVVSGFTIFAAPGADSAQIDLAVSTIKVGGIAYSLGAPVYLDITGSTGTTPISFTSGTSFDFSSFNLDWTGAITTSDSGPPPPVGYTPPPSGPPPTPSSTPEVDPASASAGLSLLLGGLAVLRGRRRR